LLHAADVSGAAIHRRGLEIDGEEGGDVTLSEVVTQAAELIGTFDGELGVGEFCGIQGDVLGRCGVGLHKTRRWRRRRRRNNQNHSQ